MLFPFRPALATCIATLEKRRPLPVDAMIPDPLFTSTHAITIDAPPERVWPWIAQMGACLSHLWDARRHAGGRSVCGQVFYGGPHAIYLLRAVATIVLSVAMTRGADAGFATAALDMVGAYSWAIGRVLTLVCALSFGGWFVAVGSQLFRMRRAA